MTALVGRSQARLVLWDFDGVVKESLSVKTEAFVQLFASYGENVAAQVRAHHEANGGMSRFDKIPIYLRYAGEEPTQARVGALCGRFSRLVRQGVIDSPWVPGAERYLRTNPYRQVFAVVSATPQEELEDILRALDLRGCFADVLGAPTSKSEAIRRVLSRHGIRPEDSLMVGDARADLDAARANGVPFLLRRHETNEGLFADYEGPSVIDMTE